MSRLSIQVQAIADEFISQFGDLDIGETDPKQVAEVRAKAEEVSQRLMQNKQHVATLQGEEAEQFRIANHCSSNPGVFFTALRKVLKETGYKWVESVGPLSLYDSNMKKAVEVRKERRRDGRQEVNGAELLKHYTETLQKEVPGIGELTNAVLGGCAMRTAELCNFDPATNTVSVTEDGKLRFCLKKTKEPVWHERETLVDVHLVKAGIEKLRAAVLQLPRQRKTKGTTGGKRKQQDEPTVPLYTAEKIVSDAVVYNSLATYLRKKAFEHLNTITEDPFKLHGHRKAYIAIMQSRKQIPDIDLMEETATLLGHQPLHHASAHYHADVVDVSSESGEETVQEEAPETQEEMTDEEWRQREVQIRQQRAALSAAILAADYLPPAKRRRMMEDI